MRTIWRCVLAVLVTGPACQGNGAEPTLVRIEPSVVGEGALPMSATIFGENLRLGMQLSLDNENAAHLAAPRVTLNGMSAAWVTYRSANQLDLMLPSALAPGVYDVSVWLDSQHPLVLPAGLHVLGASIGSSNPAGDSDETWTATTTAPGASGSATDGSSDTVNASLGTDSTYGDGGSGSGDSETTLRCRPGEFGPPHLVMVQGYTGSRPWSPTLSTNYDTLYFTDAGSGAEVLWMATRVDREPTFRGMEAPHSLFSTGGIGTPYLSANGLSLYFYSTQITGFGGGDLYVARRQTPTGDFAYPIALSPINSPQLDYLPWVSPDELTIVFVSQRTGTSAYYTASRTSRIANFGEPTPLPNLTHTENNGRLTISADGLRAYFTSRNRLGGRGSDDVWYATRASMNEDFGNITNLGVVNTPGSETQVTVTQDGEELYFVRLGVNSSQLHRSLAMCP